MTARILCVEDNAANMELMAYLLRAFGYQVTEASSGAAALDHARFEKFDLVLLDLQMPVMSGTDVLRQLRRIEGYEDLPIIAVTAVAMVGVREDVLSSGFNGYITKPLDAAHFAEQVGAFLGPGHEGGALTRPVQTRLDVEAAGERPAASDDSPLILGVDDTPSGRQLMRECLEPFGYQVLTAENTAAAIVLARTRRPALVLSDMHMPGGTGVDLARMMRAHGETRDIPVIIVTWTGTEEEARQAESEAIEMFLRRPIDPETLHTKIDALLEARR